MHQISSIFSSKIKKSISILLLGIMIFYGILFLQRATIRDSSGFKYRPFFEEDTNYDVLFFGTSHVINAIFPMQLWKDYGITSYNFGGHGNTIATTYWTMVNAIEYHKPKIAVLDVLWAGDNLSKMDVSNAHLSFDAFPLTKTKIAAVRDIYPDDKMAQFELLFPLSVYHNRWKEMTPEMLKAGLNIHTMHSKEKGAESRIKVAIPAEMRRVKENQQLDTETIGMQYIQKFITFCKEHDIVPIIINIPFPAEEELQVASNTAISLAKKQNVGTINFPYLNLVDFDIDCYDSNSHLNPSGAKKITDYIGNYLKKNYNLEDHRLEPKYKCWNDDYKEYYSYLAENIKKRDDYKELLMLSNNENFKIELEFTKEYVPDFVETKLIAQLGENIELKRKTLIATNKGEKGTVRITIRNSDTDESVVSKVYVQNRILTLLKDNN